MAMGVKSTKADQNQFEDMNPNISDEVDDWHHTKAVAQDTRTRTPSQPTSCWKSPLRWRSVT